MPQATRQLAVRVLVLALVPAMVAASTPWAQADWPTSPMLQRICMTSGDMSLHDAAYLLAQQPQDKCCSGRSTGDDSRPPVGASREGDTPAQPHSDSCPCCKFLFFTSAWTVPSQEPARLAAAETFSEPLFADACFTGDWVHRLLRPPCLLIHFSGGSLRGNAA